MRLFLLLDKKAKTNKKEVERQTMQLLSQRDPRWAKVKLGTGTIADRGCTVTALAMLLGATPDVLAAKCRFTPDGAIY